MTSPLTQNTYPLVGSPAVDTRSKVPPSTGFWALAAEGSATGPLTVRPNPPAPTVTFAALRPVSGTHATSHTRLSYFQVWAVPVPTAASCPPEAFKIAVEPCWNGQPVIVDRSS